MNKKIYFLFFLLFAPSMCFGEAKFSLEFVELPQNVDVSGYKTLFEKWEDKFRGTEDKLIPVYEILGSNDKYKYISNRYTTIRNFWHKKLQYQQINKLLAYLAEHKEKVEILEPKIMKQIIAVFKKDSIKKRKSLLSRKTNFRKKWFEKYKKVLEKQGMRIDKTEAKKTKAKLITKFKKTLRNAEVQFYKRYKETGKAFKYAYDRAVKNLEKLIKKKAPKIKDSDAPVPPPIEGLDKKREKKKKVKKEEDVPIAPPMYDLNKKKPRIKKDPKPLKKTKPTMVDELKAKLQKRREHAQGGQDIREEVVAEPDVDELDEELEIKKRIEEIEKQERKEETKSEVILEKVLSAPPVPEFEAKAKQIETKPLSPEELQAAKKKLKKTPAKKKTKKEQSELAKRIAEQKKQILKEAEESKSEDDDDWYEGD